MTITANDRKFALDDILRDLKSQAVVLGSARGRFALHYLQYSEGCLCVYAMLAEAATAMEVLATTIQDLILLEGIEMDEKQREMQNQIGHQAANPTPPPAASSAENTTGSPQGGGVLLTPDEQEEIGPGEMRERMDRFEEQLEGLDVIDVRLGKIHASIEQQIVRLDLIDRKFAGIGKAIDVIARATQKNMTESGGNGELEEEEQGG